MIIDLQIVEKLLYNHVNVATSVSKGRDRTSSFLIEDANKELTFSGYLKVYDPISGSIVLCHISEGKVAKNILILGCNISAINQTPESASHLQPIDVRRIIELDRQAKVAHHPYFQRSHSLEEQSTIHNHRNIEKLRDEIVGWLRENRLTVTTHEPSNDIIVADRIRIRPPYKHESDFVCPTNIVLKRIQHIINSRPR